MKDKEIRKLSFEQLEIWHTELCKEKAIELPNIPYTYHEIYDEMVRREEEEKYENFLFEQ